MLYMQDSETGCSKGDTPAKLDGASLKLQPGLTDTQLQTALQVIVFACCSHHARQQAHPALRLLT